MNKKKSKKPQKLRGCWLSMFERYKYRDFDGKGITDVQVCFNSLLLNWFLKKQEVGSVPSSQCVEKHAVFLLDEAEKTVALDGVDPTVIRVKAIDKAIAELGILTVKKLNENNDLFLNVHVMISTRTLTSKETEFVQETFEAEADDDCDAIPILVISVPICNEITEAKKDKIHDYCVRKLRDSFRKSAINEGLEDTGFRYGTIEKIKDYFVQISI
jgi:hypothetical protein